MTTTATIESVLDARHDDTALHGPSLGETGQIHLHRDRIRLRAVSVAGMHVGTIAEVVLDAEARRVAGFDVRLAAGERRFVPLVAVVALGPSGIELDSPLHLVEDVRYYDQAGLTLPDLLDTPASRRRDRVPVRVADVVADLATGEVLALELDDGTMVPREALSISDEAIRVA
jgi:PRC-barrel domain